MSNNITQQQKITNMQLCNDLFLGNKLKNETDMKEDFNYVHWDQVCLVSSLLNKYNEMNDYNGLWNCYNCGEMKNTIVKHAYCKSCNIGINPFHFFISNKRDPNIYDIDDYRCSIWNKKFTLAKGKFRKLILNYDCSKFAGSYQVRVFVGIYMLFTTICLVYTTIFFIFDTTKPICRI